MEAKKFLSFSDGGKRNYQEGSGVAIEFHDVSKQYRRTLPLLEAVSFSINYGEVVGLFGPSGSGKSTVLQMASALVLPDSGQVFIDQKRIFPPLNNINVSALRSSLISYLPQDDLLFEALSVFENVLLAAELNHKKNSGQEREQLIRKVEETLAALGVTELADRQIFDISAGERKRVAIGRSLVTSPKIVIADEPTSSLDPETTNDILKLIKNKSEQQKVAFFLASHDVLEVKSIADRVYGIRNHTLFKVDS